MDGIATNLVSQGIWEGTKRAYRWFSSWRFSQLFGREASEGGLHLVYGSLKPPVLMTEEGKTVQHVFSKPGQDG